MATNARCAPDARNFEQVSSSMYNATISAHGKRVRTLLSGSLRWPWSKAHLIWVANARLPSSVKTRFICRRLGVRVSTDNTA